MSKISGNLPRSGLGAPRVSKLGLTHTAPPTPSSKIGTQVSTNPKIATGPSVSPRASNAEHRSQIDTFITKAGDTMEFYSADRLWARVTLCLETAGPVAIGTMATLQPVLSGVGQLLITGEPVSIVIAKGNVLYIAATGVNRVKRTIEPFPWLEAITGLTEIMAGGISPTALANAKNQY